MKYLSGKIVKTSFFIFFILCQIAALHAQNTFYVLEIKVIDNKTTLTIKDTEINFQRIGKKIKTGADGIVKSILPPGNNQIEINHPEYYRKNISLQIQSDTTIVVDMETIMRSYVIKDIDINSKFTDKVTERSIGYEKINLTEARKIPSIFCEMDIIRNITLLPGTSFSTEAATDLSVRGGLPNQNLILFDNATLYSSSNLMGLISPFQSSVIEEVNFHKGYIPERLGGRCSSVIETFTKSGLSDKMHGELNIGLINSSLYTAIPIKKKSITLYMGVRSTYLDLLQKIAKQGNSAELAFRDFYTKTIFNISEKTKGSVSFLANYDGENLLREVGVRVKEETKTARKNLLAQCTIETNTKNQKNLFNLYYSSFNNGLSYIEKYKSSDSIGSNFKFTSAISELTIKNHYTIKMLDVEYNVGIQSSYYQLLPFNATSVIENKNIFIIEQKKHHLFENDIYAGLSYSVSKKISTQIGLRLNSYANGDYLSLHPELRAFLHYNIDKNSTIKASFSTLTQGLNLLKNTGIGMQYDIWVPSTKDINPQRSSIISLGIFQNIKVWDIALNTSAELYYKSQQNIVSYLDGYDSNSFIFRNSQLNGTWENAITTGNGKAWGMELLVEKQTGVLTGSVSYTLSWAYHQFDLLNQGKIFPSPYDRRHNFSFSGTYNINKKWDLGINWIFASGAPITLPVAAYNSVTIDFQSTKPSTPSIWDQYPILVMTERNSFRMKPYHRLDLSMQRTYALKKNRKGILKFSIYNVYNRKNPYFYYLVNETKKADMPGKNTLYSASLLPIIPSVSYTFIF